MHLTQHKPHKRLPLIKKWVKKSFKQFFSASVESRQREVLKGNCHCCAAWVSRTVYRQALCGTNHFAPFEYAHFIALEYQCLIKLMDQCVCAVEGILAVRLLWYHWLIKAYHKLTYGHITMAECIVLNMLMSMVNYYDSSPTVRTGSRHHQWCSWRSQAHTAQQQHV